MNPISAVDPIPGQISAFAPGRVNLIGEHTDYNDGLALAFAVRMGVTVRAQAGTHGRIEAVALDLGERDAFPVATPSASDGWRAFVRGAAAELRRAGIEPAPTRLTISGEIPQNAGLSSSAALTIALCLALIGVAGDAVPEPLALARICSGVERRWVGANTGLLDQLASLRGREGHALLIDFSTFATEQVPLHLGTHRLVVLDSGEPRSLAASGYNERRSECERARTMLGLASLREASSASAATLPDPLCRRVRHVVSENERVRGAVAALRAGDLAELGRLIDESHRSLRDDYGVSTDAVEATVERLREAGAIGARLIGGGFGGSVLGLLPQGAVPPDGALEVKPGPGASLSGRPPGGEPASPA